MGDEKGFTLVELIFSIVFACVFAAAAAVIVFAGYTVYKNGKKCDFYADKCIGQIVQEIKK